MHTRWQWFWRGIEEAALAGFICMLVLVTLQVFFRYVLEVSVPWTEEAARWFYAYQIFLGCAIAAREGMDVRTTLILDRLPDRLKAAVECLVAVGGLVFFGGIAYGGAVMIWAVSAVEAGSFRLSMSYLYVAIPVSFTLLFLLTLRNLGRNWRTLLQSPKA
jgi:TRAP-type C4-dicarboxylate transport system permease small subunit